MKIVCAIDGSRYSEWALDWVRRLIHAGALSGLSGQEAGSHHLKKVVLGTDGSIESWKAVTWLMRLPEIIRPAVTVAGVIPPLPLESIRIPAQALAVVIRSKECSGAKPRNSRPASRVR